MPFLRKLNIADYNNLLDEIRFTSSEIKEKLVDFHLEFIRDRNDVVEHGLSIPLFVPAFYDCIKTFDYIPSPDESFGYYLDYNKGEFEKINRNDLIDGIKARFLRTYPSLMRDLHFNKYLSENLPKYYHVVYNTRLDIEEGIDLLVTSPNAYYGLCFYTDTQRGNMGRSWKQDRHTYFGNVEFIEYAINKEDADIISTKGEDFFLYGVKAYEDVLALLKEKEAKYQRIIPLVDDPPIKERFISYLPLYSIKAACGYFGEGEDVDALSWVSVEGMGKLNRNMYVVQASGHSMEPRIHDGDYCVFEANPAGSRQGKIVLAQHRGFYDNDNAGAYSIKVYESTKTFDEFGNWQHESITLKPLNTDYQPIILSPEDIEDFRIVGSFIGVLTPTKDISKKPNEKGFCIRCGKRIDFNPSRCYCKSCWYDWYRSGSNNTQIERYCHRCGKPLPSSFNNPTHQSNCL